MCIRRFIPNRKKNILSETICRFCSCAFFKIYTAKSVVWPKMVLTYANSIVNWIFIYFLSFSFFFFFFFFVCFVSLIWSYRCSITYCEHFRTFEQMELLEYLAASKLHVPTLLILPMTRIKHFVHRYLRQMIWFAFNYAKSIQIYYFCVKCQEKTT